MRRDPWTVPTWEAAKANREDIPVQVVLAIEQMDAFREWVESMGWRIFPIPVEDDLATFALAPPREPLADD